MKTILLLILIWPLFLFGQVTFNKIPIDKQLVARGITTNKGNVIFDGQVDNSSTPYDSIEIDIYRNGVYQSTDQKSLTYSGNVALFNFDIEILAELANYKFEIFGKIGTSRVFERTVDEIVAGDVYIIEGQSNAVAGIRSGSANGNQNNFVRVFANGTTNESSLLSNNNWFIGQGDGSNGTNGNTGQWGLKLARLLVDSQGIPIAIFNGARGGRGIQYFLKNSTDDENGLSPNLNNYERLNYRLEKANLKDQVRAVFWSQGENTGSFNTYKSKFESLRNSWLVDHPNIEKFYIFQTKQACTIDQVSLDQQNQIKEAQRQVSEDYSDVHIMTTDAIMQYSDICHFIYTGGYEVFATRIFPLVQRDFYGVNTAIEIEPPHITAAYLSNYTTLIVETDANSLQIVGSAENFELNNANGATINDIQVSGNSIIFTLSSYPGDNAVISNLGEDPGQSVNFITNSNSIEVVCFYEYPIDPLPNSTSWNGSMWTNNIPPLPTIDAIINDDYSTHDGNIVAQNLTVNADIDFDEGTANSIVVHGDLDISGGSMTIGDQESLVMYKDNAIITGIITKNESSTSLENINDYTYWSSPVENVNISSVFAHPTYDQGRLYYWDQSAPNVISGGGSEALGEWIPAAGLTTIKGKGYISQGPIDGTYPGPANVSFTGRPTSGSVDLIGGNDVVFNDNTNPEDDLNLIGNPYPSAIDADAFINEVNNAASINGTLWFWTHRTPNNGNATGEQYSSDDYAAYNLTGGTKSASGSPEPTRYIGSGQGFMVQTNSTVQKISFRNAMRVKDLNTQFFRGGETKNTLAHQKDRIWLNLESSEGGAFSQILVGFMEKATDGFDRAYDGIRIGGGWVNLYSKIDTLKYGIQGLSSFNLDKKVPLAFDTYINDAAVSYKISIDHMEGVLIDNDLYLVDHELNIIHDLKQGSYNFTVNATGSYGDRFTLQFTKSTLGIDELALDNKFVVINEENSLRLRSNSVISNIKVYDITGRLLIDNKPNNNEFSISTQNIRQGTVLILNATFENGAKASNKVIKY